MRHVRCHSTDHRIACCAVCAGGTWNCAGTAGCCRAVLWRVGLWQGGGVVGYVVLARLPYLRPDPAGSRQPQRRGTATGSLGRGPSPLTSTPDTPQCTAGELGLALGAALGAGWAPRAASGSREIPDFTVSDQHARVSHSFQPRGYFSVGLACARVLEHTHDSQSHSRLSD